VWSVFFFNHLKQKINFAFVFIFVKGLYRAIKHVRIDFENVCFPDDPTHRLQNMGWDLKDITAVKAVWEGL